MSDVYVSDVLSEANALYNEISEVSTQNSNIENALELMEEIGDSAGGLVQESFNPINTRLLRNTLKRIVGVNLEDHYQIKLEDGMNITQTNLVMESIGALIKEFWQALKNSFNSVWSKLKSWYITITSASESLVKKANKLRTRAERSSSTPKEKKFDFKNHANVSIGNKLTSAGLREGLELTKKILEQTLNVRTTNEVENFIEAADNALENFIKSSNANNPDASWVNRFSSLYTPSVGLGLSPVTDKDIKEQIVTDEPNTVAKMTPTLPGNIAVVYVSLTSDSSLQMAEKISLISARLVKTSFKEVPSSLNVDVLYPEQISNFCDLVIDLNEQITFYEKAWQRRDKFMNKVLSSLDKSISKIDSEDLEDGQDKVYKKTVRAILSAIKRSNTFNAALINYVVRVSSSTLSYCETSLSQFESA